MPPDARIPRPTTDGEARGQPHLDPALAMQAMLAEYNSLRQESLNSIGNRVTIANFTFGALALILAALVSQARPTTVTGILALVFVPQIAKVGLMIWLGEYNRSQRAGKWIAELEDRVNRTVGGDRVLAWETALLSNSVHMSYPYVSVVLLLLGVGWTSVVFGATVLFQALGLRLTEVSGIAAAGAVSAAVIVVEVWFLRFFRAKWRQIKTEYSRDGHPVWTV